MPYTLAALGRNIVAGARLAFLLPVSRLRFRVDATQLLLLVLLSALIDIGADWLRYGPDGSLSLAGIGSEMAATAVLLLTAALLAAWCRSRDLLLAVPVIVLAAFIPLQLVNVALDLMPRVLRHGALSLDIARYAYALWLVLVLMRAVSVALEGRRDRIGRAVIGGLLLAVPLFIPSGILPGDSWWESEDAARVGDVSPASEPVLALQRQLQDDALASLEDHTPGATDLYFIGFAPDGAGATWRERIDSARQVLEGHWRADGRTIGYVNDPQAVTDAPFATVSHLREALSEMAAASDPEEDVIMVYVAGRSNPDGSLVVSLPPLDLVQLSGPGLRSLLDEAGFRWRIVVVGTCNPGPFIDALADDNTVVMANAARGEDVAECAGRGEPVAFGDALFNDGLPRATSIAAAFELAKRRLAEPRASGQVAAVPFLHMGADIAGKLDAVKGRSTSGLMARYGRR